MRWDVPEHPTVRWIEATGYPREYWRRAAGACPTIWNEKAGRTRKFASTRENKRKNDTERVGSNEQ